MLRVAAGCKGIRRFPWNDIDPRHGKLRLDGKLADSTIELWRLLLRDLLCTVRHKDDLVRKPVHPEIHKQGKGKSDEQPLFSSKPLADQHQEPHHQNHQTDRFYHIHDATLLKTTE